MFFLSGEPVTGEPNGPSGALFARSNGVTRMISRGADSPHEVQPEFAGSTADGSTAYFYLPNFIDSNSWTYVLDRWRGSGIETISDGAGFICANATGSQVVFLSYRALTSDDHDSRGDLYALSSSGLRLLTPGASEADGAADIGPWGHTPDCSRVFFNTWEQLTSADDDSRFDVYGVNVGSGAVRLESTGPAAAGGGAVGYAGSSAGGTHVYFTTDGKLYDHAGNVTRLVTAAADAAFKGASADGSHVFFESAQPLSPDDKDSETDVYDWTAGGTQLASTGHSPTAGYSVFAGASADGSHVIFSTATRVEPNDMDSDRDLYDRHAGSTTLISGGAPSDRSDRPELLAISPAGDRIVFGSARPLTPDDTDASDDIYVSSNRSLRLLSIGPAGGNGDANAAFLGASADASRIFFETSEGLVPSDTDGQWDIYSAEVPTLAPPPDDPGGGGNGNGGDGNGGNGGEGGGAGGPPPPPPPAGPPPAKRGPAAAPPPAP